MRREDKDYDIIPSTQWIILYEDKSGIRPMIDVKKHSIESYEDAREVAQYYKEKYPNRYKHGKITFKKVPYEEVWGDIYRRGAHGGRRYKVTPRERENIRKEQEESDSYGPPYREFPQLSDDEIEPRSQEDIYRMGGLKALKEYEEGINDRKKKSSKSKIKRPLNQKAGDKLQSMYTIKNFGVNAGTKLESIYRIKKNSKSPKRKVIKKSK